MNKTRKELEEEIKLLQVELLSIRRAENEALAQNLVGKCFTRLEDAEDIHRSWIKVLSSDPFGNLTIISFHVEIHEDWAKFDLRPVVVTLEYFRDAKQIEESVFEEALDNLKSKVYEIG